MKTVLILAAGVWLGREIFAVRMENWKREQEVKIRKSLESFLQENFPQWSRTKIQKTIQGMLQ